MYGGIKNEQDMRIKFSNEQSFANPLSIDPNY